MNISCQLAVDRSLFLESETHHLVIRLEAPEAATQTRRPVAFGIVLDRSSSMDGAAIENAKKACELVVRHLGREDHLTLVTFATGAETVIPFGLAKHQETMRQAIAKIESAGSTNLSAGWMLAREEMLKSPENMVRRLLLLTDGQTNQGVVDPEIIAKMVMTGCEHDRIRTSCLGFGNAYNETLLRNLAKVSGGQLYDAVSPEALPGIFQQELEGLKQTVVQNVRIRIKKGDFVDQLGQLSDSHQVTLADKREEMSVGDLLMGEERALVLEMNVLPIPKANNVPVASLEGEVLVELEIVWDEIQNERVVSNKREQVIRLQRAQNSEEIKLNQETLFFVTTQKAGHVVDAATKAMDQDRVSEAKELVLKAIERIKAYGTNERTQDAIRLLENLLPMLEEGREFRDQSRKSAIYASSSYRTFSSKSAWTARHSPLADAEYHRTMREARAIVKARALKEAEEAQEAQNKIPPPEEPGQEV